MRVPSREKRQKTCLRDSTGHLLQCCLKARPAELRRFSAILAIMQPNFSATQTGWRRDRDPNLHYPRLPDRPRALPQREGDSGAGRRLEAAREMAVAGRWPGEDVGISKSALLSRAH